MPTDTIEAVWTDPIFRSELLASTSGAIPTHPAGDISDRRESIGSRNETATRDYSYGNLCFTTENQCITLFLSGEVCCG
jgi:hypothetical protein